MKHYRELSITQITQGAKQRTSFRFFLDVLAYLRIEDERSNGTKIAKQ